MQAPHIKRVTAGIDFSDWTGPVLLAAADPEDSLSAQLHTDSAGGAAIRCRPVAAQHKPLLETTIFGTTSVRVMRHAACPVLAVVQHYER